jgi:hypothetical protein
MEIRSFSNECSCVVDYDSDDDNFQPMTAEQKSALERFIRQAPKQIIEGEIWYTLQLTDKARKYYESFLPRSLAVRGNLQLRYTLSQDSWIFGA